MKHLKLYESFQTEQEIADICKQYNIKNWSINSEGLVDVNGDVSLSYKELDKLPLKFGKVTSNFDCGFNNLTSLEGGPKEVGGEFYCDSNKLINLKGAPVEVVGDFNCEYNQLTSLKGGPEKVGGNFYCNNNQLVSLKGSSRNIGGHFECRDNQITSFESSPDFVGGDFYCMYNPIYNIWELFKDYSKIELFNYYDIIRDLNGEPAIVLARLNQFLEDIGKPPIEKVEGYINI